jgi:hypothetical protein
MTALTADQLQTLAPLYEQGAKALKAGDRTEMGRAALLIQAALEKVGLASEQALPLAEEALLRNGNHRYQYAPSREGYVSYEQERNTFECCLTKEDYQAGWGVSRKKALGETWYPDYMSAWDSNDYEYQQELVNN